MARVTFVKKAQQRYRTVPVMDPETGKQKQTPVIDKRTGKQKVSKRGPVFMGVTKADKSQPLPNRKCDKCGVEIKVGDPYKHISPKSGPYGGMTRYRCAACPTWQVWEYSSSLSARTAQIEHDLDSALDAVESMEDLESALEDAASEIESLAEEKEEGASNIEEGFGHETQASEELREVSEQLTEWAEEVRSAADSLDEYEEESECEECSGSGEKDCEECDGTGDDVGDPRFFVRNADGSGNVFEEQPEGFETEEEAQEALTAYLTQTGDKPERFEIIEAQANCPDCEGAGHLDCDECNGTGQVENDFSEWWADARDNLSIECPV